MVLSQSIPQYACGSVDIIRRGARGASIGPMNRCSCSVQRAASRWRNAGVHWTLVGVVFVRAQCHAMRATERRPCRQRLSRSAVPVARVTWRIDRPGAFPVLDLSKCLDKPACRCAFARSLNTCRASFRSRLRPPGSRQRFSPWKSTSGLRPQAPGGPSSSLGDSS